MIYDVTKGLDTCPKLPLSKHVEGKTKHQFQQEAKNMKLYGDPGFLNNSSH